jgi:L-threonylcarbamoyladenylate synthase
MSTDSRPPQGFSSTVPAQQVENGQSVSVLCPASGFRRAVALLRAGQLVAFPTDTVYGVGAVIWNRMAIRQLYGAKLRPSDKAIPVLLASAVDLPLVACDLSHSALRLAERFWPGPLTMVVPRAPAVPDEVSAGGATVAVRVPDHELARALIVAAGAPLAATSANLSGQPSPVTAQEVATQLGGRIPLVLDGGPCPGGIASTVVDLSGPELVILRPGPVRMRDILSALDK